MSGLLGYFVAPDANGDVWIWRGRDATPVAVLSRRGFRDDPELWAYFTRDMHHVEGAS